uniref:Uncharacterized shell protein 1-like n=1 Tax=Crassostrea virginica TaxID=6565 RepID=A0A8B8ES60_CRAVI|nr:uncharacterized shell protein 1-like [Crassostrea virginica]
MQKLIFVALLFTLAAVYAKRPNYARQGRSPVDACRLDCMYDAVMCGAPCRLLFRSHRMGYFNCAKDCSRDRVVCFSSCETKTQAPTVPAEPVATAAAAAAAAAGPAAKSSHHAHAAPTQGASLVEADGQETGDSDESVED